RLIATQLARHVKSQPPHLSLLAERLVSRSYRTPINRFALRLKVTYVCQRELSSFLRSFSLSKVVLTQGKRTRGTGLPKNGHSFSHPSPPVIFRISKSLPRSLKYSITSRLCRSYRSM